MSKPFYKGPSVHQPGKIFVLLGRNISGGGRQEEASFHQGACVNGGKFEGERITAKLTERLAYQWGMQIAFAEVEEY